MSALFHRYAYSLHRDIFCKVASVRPNTEYSAEYSAKTRRIFGTEYSAKSADTPITENRVKMAVFDPFYLKFWSYFGHTCFTNSYLIFYLLITIKNDNFAVIFASYSETIIFSSFMENFWGQIGQLLHRLFRQLSAEYSAEYSVRSSRIFGIGRYQFWAYRSFTT